MRVWAARLVVPIASPPVRDGAVAVLGDRIVAVGPRRQVLDAVGPAAECRDLGSAVLLPGLVNTHVHLELSWLAAEPPPGGDFMRWLRGLLERRQREDAPTARAAAERAIAEVSALGTAAVGDVGNGGWIIPLLARSELHGVAFHEIYAFKAAEGERRMADAAAYLARLDADPDCAAARSRLDTTLTPHAPYTTSAPLLRALAGHSAATGRPLTVHVAEGAAEVELLSAGSGPLAELLAERGQWDAGWVCPRLSPVAYLDRVGLLSPRTLAVHCVQLTHQDQSLLQARRATVVTCPRSNERLGLGPAPVPALLRAGIPVALGTDSLASSPDLDPFAELAALHRIHAGLTPAAVLRVATLNGARALGVADRLGSIEPGKLARLVVVPLAEAEPEPLEAVCAHPQRLHWLEQAPWEAATA